MKVLFDSHSADFQPTGIGRYCQNLTQSLEKLSPVSLIQYTNNPQKKGSYFPLRNGLARISLGLPIAQTLTKPDLLHIHYFTPFIKTTPIVSTIHDICFLTHPKSYTPKQRLMFKLFLKTSLKKTDHFITPTQHAKETLAKHYSIPKEKITPIHHAPDPFFQKPKNPKLIKKTLKKYQLKKPFFLSVGYLEKRKNPQEITKTFIKLKSSHPNLSLVFAGPIKNKSLLKPFHPLKQKNIHLLGHIKNQDLKNLYHETISLIYFSKCEGFGLPILEAAACQTPVITSNIPPHQEITQNKALLVKTSNQLKKAMQNLLEDPAKRKKIAKNLHKHSKKFSWEKSAQKTLSVYRKTLKNS